jgi:branched-chain amino acid transport system substrate-binding protein
VRSHFDGMEVHIADAPRADEIVVAVAVTDSGRPLPRVGGLKADEIKARTACGSGRALLQSRFKRENRGMTTGSTRVLALAALAGIAISSPGLAQQGEIRIGEINSYSGLPAFTEPYRKGWQLAVEEINAKGGVNGRKLVVISRDDGGRPADAVTAANELLSREKVDFLAGAFFSHIGLALADFAKQKQVFYLAGEPLTDAIVWSQGNKYTFRLRPSNYMQAAMLAEEAAKLPAKKWATIAPNYEYGQSAVAVFKQLLSAKRPDIEWVGEQWPPQGKIDAGPVDPGRSRP